MTHCAIELNFDPASEQRVRDIWQSLADAGVSRSMLQSNSRPHISFDVSDSFDPDRIGDALHAFTQSLAVVPVRLMSLGMFLTDPAVLFLAPVVTPLLLDAHRACHELIRPIAVNPRPYCQPDAWTPHCTLAFSVDRLRLHDAVEACERVSLPIAARLESVSLVQYRPAQAMMTLPLRSM